MHPMIMITSELDGIVYLSGAYMGEVHPGAPIFRPVPPFGAVFLELHPFAPMTLFSACRIVFSNGKPLSDSIPHAGAVSVDIWPFGITEVAMRPESIYAHSPTVKNLTAAGRQFKYIKTPSSAGLEAEYRGRIFAHPLPEGALEPLLAEGEGVLYASGSTESMEKYALSLSVTGESMLISIKGKAISFLPDGKILLTQEAGDLSGHEIRTLLKRCDSGYETEKTEILPNPSGEFHALTPAQSAVCALDAMRFHLKDELDACVSDGFSPDQALWDLTREAISVRELTFTPPDGRNAVAVIRQITPSVKEAVPVYYQARMTDGVWKITHLKAW